MSSVVRRNSTMSQTIDSTPTRFIALIISIFVSLAAGTPYLYGVYSPQLVARCGLTATDSALISFSTNIGSGFGGFLAGLMIDKKGPQFSILVGSICIFFGYYSLYEAYVHRISQVYLLCLPMILVGFGSITSYFSTLKAAQHNFPNHRGLAGAFPVSAYGLSATVFSVIAASEFEGNTSGFLKFLAIFCGSLAFFGGFFIKICDEEDSGNDTDEEDEQTLSSNYGSFSSLRDSEGSESSVPMKKPTTTISPMSAWGKRRISLRGSLSFWGIGDRTPRGSISSVDSDYRPLLPSKISRNNSAVFEDTESAYAIRTKIKKQKSTMEVVSELVSSKLFLTYFLVLSLIASVGQMYIFVVGFMVTAQAQKSNSIPFNSDQAQALQVSIVSISSFVARLVSGATSDFIYKRYKCQRLWVIFGSSLVLFAGQISALYIDSIDSLWVLSLAMGGSYGLIFGTFPAVVADKFGTSAFSTTWGFMCIGPVVMYFLLNKYFGKIYDSHSVTDRNDHGDIIKVCRLGKGCYQEVFRLGGGICVVLFFLILLVIYRQRKR